MKSLSLAILIALSVSVLIFVIFNAFGVGKQVAAPLASTSLGLITFIHDKVDKALSAGKSHVSPGIVPVSGFGIRWPFMLVYVVLITIGISELATAAYLIPTYLSAGSAGPSGADPSALVQGAALFSIPAVAWGIFLLGRWVGIRAARAGYWILPLGFVLGRALEDTAMSGLLPQSRRMLMATLSTRIGLISLAALLSLILGFGVIGVWRGNRVRLGAYFNSLLRQVSESTRETLLSITYEEANRGKVQAQ